MNSGKSCEVRPWSPERLALDIASPATAEGEAGIAAFDLDGPRALDRISEIFSIAGGKGRKVSAGDCGKLLYGRLIFPDGRLADEAVLAVHDPRHSVSKRCAATISSHGGRGIRAAVLAALKEAGFEEALPGEMAARAHLAGTLSLVEVERDLRLTACATRRQAAMLLRSTDRIVEGIGRMAMDGLLNFRAGKADWRSEIAREIDILISGAARAGALLRRHAVVVAGPTNAGKSSLINAICGEERVIVSDIPGTTRDVVWVNLSLNGLSVAMADTAGLRPPAGDVEREGQSMALHAAAAADLTIVLLEGCRPVTPWEEAALSALNRARTMIVVSKADAATYFGEDDAEAVARRFGQKDVIRVSARDGSGIRRLADAIEKFLLGERPAAGQEREDSGVRNAGRGEDVEGSRAGNAGGADGSANDEGCGKADRADTGLFTRRQIRRAKELLDILLSSETAVKTVSAVRMMIGTQPDAAGLAEVFEEAEAASHRSGAERAGL